MSYEPMVWPLAGCCREQSAGPVHGPHGWRPSLWGGNRTRYYRYYRRDADIGGCRARGTISVVSNAEAKALHS